MCVCVRVCVCVLLYSGKHCGGGNIGEISYLDYLKRKLSKSPTNEIAMDMNIM